MNILIKIIYIIYILFIMANTVSDISACKNFNMALHNVSQRYASNNGVPWVRSYATGIPSPSNSLLPISHNPLSLCNNNPVTYSLYQQKLNKKKFIYNNKNSTSISTANIPKNIVYSMIARGISPHGHPKITRTSQTISYTNSNTLNHIKNCNNILIPCSNDTSITITPDSTLTYYLVNRRSTVTITAAAKLFADLIISLTNESTQFSNYTVLLPPDITMNNGEFTITPSQFTNNTLQLTFDLSSIDLSNDVILHHKYAQNSHNLNCSKFENTKTIYYPLNDLSLTCIVDPSSSIGGCTISIENIDDTSFLCSLYSCDISYNPGEDPSFNYTNNILTTADISFIWFVPTSDVISYETNQYALIDTDIINTNSVTFDICGSSNINNWLLQHPSKDIYLIAHQKDNYVLITPAIHIDISLVHNVGVYGDCSINIISSGRIYPNLDPPDIRYIYCGLFRTKHVNKSGHVLADLNTNNLITDISWHNGTFDTISGESGGIKYIKIPINTINQSIESTEGGNIPQNLHIDISNLPLHGAYFGFDVSLSNNDNINEMGIITNQITKQNNFVFLSHPHRVNLSLTLVDPGILNSSGTIKITNGNISGDICGNLYCAFFNTDRLINNSFHDYVTNETITVTVDNSYHILNTSNRTFPITAEYFNSKNHDISFTFNISTEYIIPPYFGINSMDPVRNVLITEIIPIKMFAEPVTLTISQSNEVINNQGIITITGTADIYEDLSYGFYTSPQAYTQIPNNSITSSPEIISKTTFNISNSIDIPFTINGSEYILEPPYFRIDSNININVSNNNFKIKVPDPISYSFNFDSTTHASGPPYPSSPSSMAANRSTISLTYTSPFPIHGYSSTETNFRAAFNDILNISNLSDLETGWTIEIIPQSSTLNYYFLGALPYNNVNITGNESSGGNSTVTLFMNKLLVTQRGGRDITFGGSITLTNHLVHNH